MKKTLLLLSFSVALAFGAYAQCTPDTTNFGAGVYVYPGTLPCIQQSTTYSETQTVKIPDSLSLTELGQTVQGHIDSAQIDSISGYPAGISSMSSPSLGTWLLPGQYECAMFMGTTTATAGNYILTVSGHACGHFTIPIVGGTFDTCMAYSFTNSFPDTLKVCGNLGVNSISQDLNLSIYPNPNQGNFTVTISSVSAISGTVSVMDELGRIITTENVEVTGTKQIPLELGNVTPGAYLLVLNSQNGRSVKQFIVK